MAGTLSCPENYVPVRLPPLPYKSDTTNWQFPRTTTNDSYSFPKKRKAIVTREGRFEQFIWHEIYHEYLRAAQQQPKEEPRISEYTEQFTKTTSIEIDDNENEKMIHLISKYPVYDSEPISFWNPTGVQSNQFKNVAKITRPVQLQNTQFG